MQTDEVVLNDLMLTKAEAAALLKVTTKTLENWERDQKGPPFVRVVGVVRYPKRWLSDWLKSQAVVPAA